MPNTVEVCTAEALWYFCSLWRDLSWEKSLWVICKILRLFCYHIDCRWQVVLSKNQESFLIIFFCIFDIQITVSMDWNYRWPSELMYFANDKFRRTWLDKCLNSPVSENPSTSDMVNRPKHCYNLKTSPFTIFLDHCEHNWVSFSNM